MTISDSHAVGINAASSLLANSADKYQSVNVAEQAISGLASLGSTFSEFFVGAQQVNNSLTPQVSTEIDNKDNKDNSVNRMQQNLFSSLGLGLLSGESTGGALAQLTSQSSIEMMQATMLSALQASLMPAQSTTTTGSESTSTAGADDVVEESAINKLAQFSFGENGLDLNDGFDTFNILQHIPIVSAIYQEVSGQDISAASKLAGGYFYGGPIGFAFSALDIVTESFSGRSLNETLASFDYAGIFDNENVEQPSQLPQQPQQTDQTKAEYFSLASQMAKKVAQ